MVQQVFQLFALFGFCWSKSNTSPFIFRRGFETAYLLLSIDDIVLTILALQWEFSKKDLGQLHHFLGIFVHRQSTGIFLSQWQYMMEIIEQLVMIDSKPCTTLVDISSKLSDDTGDTISDPT
jgi:hypothetical protein